MLSYHKSGKVPHHMAIIAAVVLVISSASNYWYSHSYMENGQGLASSTVATTASTESNSASLLVDLGFYLLGL